LVVLITGIGDVAMANVVKLFTAMSRAHTFTHNQDLTTTTTTTHQNNNNNQFTVDFHNTKTGGGHRTQLAMQSKRFWHKRIVWTCKITKKKNLRNLSL
jgi:hypothetical protein